MKKFVFAILLISLLISCTSVPVKIPTVMDKQYAVLGEGEGSAVGIMLFNCIPIGQNQRLDRAYKDAIYSKNGDALINPVISERWFWAYVLNGYVTTVKGTVIKYK
ncbi:MAG TPA: hypothetical protein VLX29_08320 [Nitrospirota bacterium]|nr:hypothetical protein [Nitrospirota bacterium]